MRLFLILIGDFMQYIIIDKSNIGEFIEKNIVLICKLRPSRIKCKQLAVIEIMSLLNSFDPLFITNGPLGDVKGCISISLSKSKFLKERVINLLCYLGYTYSFYCVDFDNPELESDQDIVSINPFIWKGKKFSVSKFYEEPADAFREQAPDKRVFKLMCDDGVIRSIKGYRGDGSEMGRRALPVEDCRLLTNIVVRENTKTFLDPFCGSGGIIFQARMRNNIEQLYSVDIAKELAPGLEEYGAKHFIGAASNFTPDRSIDAVATEVPFSNSATEAICEGFYNIKDYLSNNCVIAIMYATSQKKHIERKLIEMGYHISLSQPVDRKGTDVQISICYCSELERDEFKKLWERLRFLS